MGRPNLIARIPIERDNRALNPDEKEVRRVHVVSFCPERSPGASFTYASDGRSAVLTN
jgi:hypothetical protein